MIHVIASLRIKEGRVAEFIEIFRANMPNVLKEQGCIEYLPTIDVPTGLPPQDLNEHGVTVVERWACLGDLRAHLSSRHMLAYGKQVKDLVENTSLKILRDA